MGPGETRNVEFELRGFENKTRQATGRIEEHVLTGGECTCISDLRWVSVGIRWSQICRWAVCNAVGLNQRRWIPGTPRSVPLRGACGGSGDWGINGANMVPAVRVIYVYCLFYILYLWSLIWNLSCSLVPRRVRVNPNPNPNPVSTVLGIHDHLLPYLVFHLRHTNGGWRLVGVLFCLTVCRLRWNPLG